MKWDVIIFPFREAFLAFRTNRGPNVFSMISVALCMLMLGFFAVGWRNLEHLVELARSEAEITVYLTDSITPEQFESIVDALSSRPGVIKVSHVTREQAFARMKRLLGTEADLLDALEGLNPFSAYLEVRVVPEEAPDIAKIASSLGGVEKVRENREVLMRLISLTKLVKSLGIVITIAAGLISVVVISHMIRLGIHARREEIETLRLLGASERFIRTPFLIEGLAIGFGGSVLAIFLTCVAYRWGALLLSNSLPFLPLAPSGLVLGASSSLMAAVGLGCGLLGTLLALRPEKSPSSD